MEKKDDRANFFALEFELPIYRICCTCLRFEFLYIETHAIFPGNTQAWNATFEYLQKLQSKHIHVKVVN